MGARIDLPIHEIAARYRAGESTYELGRAFGVCRTTIAARLVAAGVKMRDRGKAGGRAPEGKPTICRGYLVVKGRSGQLRSVHRTCYETHYGTISDDFIIHHCNGNRLDNRIENLACMTQGDHMRLHARQRRARPMTELDKAASAASEALGMNVECYGPGNDGECGVEIHPALDDPASGNGPLETHTIHGEEDTAFATLAYLSGLETGARIQRERYAPLVGAAHHMCEYLPKTQGWTDEWDGVDGGTWVGPELSHVAEALSQLEE